MGDIDIYVDGDGSSQYPDDDSYACPVYGEDPLDACDGDADDIDDAADNIDDAADEPLYPDKLTKDKLAAIVATCMQNSSYRTKENFMTPKLTKTMHAQLWHSFRRSWTDLMLDYLQYGIGANMSGFVAPVTVSAAMLPYRDIANGMPKHGTFSAATLYAECLRQGVSVEPLYERVNAWAPVGMPHFTCVASPNVLHWFIYLRMANFSETSPTRCGEYLIVLICPEDFPAKPPEFAFLTENGIYTVKTTALCVDGGRYHPDTYNATLGMQGFLTRIIDSMENPKGLVSGIGIKNVTNSEEISRRALASRAYNVALYSHVLDYIRRTTDYRNAHDSYVAEANAIIEKERAASAKEAEKAALEAKGDELFDFILNS